MKHLERHLMHCNNATFEHLFFDDYRFVHVLNVQYVPGPGVGALYTVWTISDPLCCCCSCHVNEEWYKQTDDIPTSF